MNIKEIDKIIDIVFMNFFLYSGIFGTIIYAFNKSLLLLTVSLVSLIIAGALNYEVRKWDHYKYTLKERQEFQQRIK